MSWLYLALLAGAGAVLIGAEWPRLAVRLGVERRRTRAKAKRKANLKLLRSESEEFAASVQRDLSRLPTTEEREQRRR